MGKLQLNPELVNKCRRAAGEIVQNTQQFIEAHTTTSVERAVVRLLGIDGVDDRGVPLPNLLVEQVQQAGLLNRGIAFWLANGALALGVTLQELAVRVGAGKVNLVNLPLQELQQIRKVVDEWAALAVKAIDHQRNLRQEKLVKLGEGPQPYLYVIVATGNIYEDVVQAQAAARQGADIIAVIRSTGQSLLDYVPFGATIEGQGGTYATQENFRIMRKALDSVSEEVGRYVRLTNYCSGLCMPEIAVMGALERLDVMLNDSMYGIIFRDINMQRTFVDQYFSRLINGYSGIIINTGEDNYLTTADAVEAAHTVLASQFINEQFALVSEVPEELMGLGHAFEINPDLEDGFLLELAHAQLVREVFPKAPVKYMPPTKFMSGNVFQGQVQNALFNVASIMTGQGIHLLGMLTEAIHTPLLQDRYLSLKNARYVFNTMRHLGDELEFKTDGIIEKRAVEVLSKASTLLEEIAQIGLMTAIGKGYFGDISRQPDGGKGLSGVIRKDAGYYNPFIKLFSKRREQ